MILTGSPPSDTKIPISGLDGANAPGAKPTVGTEDWGQRRQIADRQTVDHIEAACYYLINLIPWRLERARRRRTKGLSITGW